MQNKIFVFYQIIYQFAYRSLTTDAMVTSFRKGPGARRLLFSLLLAAWELGSGQLHYSVPEEAKHGTFVGRIAQDLGLELAELVPRLFRVASKGRGDLLEVNLQNGILFVNSRIDREELCGRSAACGIHLEVIVEQPLQVFHVEVEVKDINDHPPVFPWSQKTLSILESRLPDSRFPLEGATDLDIGSNAVLTYRLTPSDYFSLNVISKSDQNKLIVLVLKKSLDREEIREHALLLTATDGGKPELTGSVKLLIKVLDVNDNAPEFQQSVYEVNLRENAINWTSVITLNASDVDEGPNQEITYHFSSDVSSRITEIFTIIMNTGEIRLKGNLDYEKVTSYEILVEAVDKGAPQMRGHCTVLVNVLDINDNAPDVSVTSLTLPIREDAPQSTVIALISVSDRDSGANGQVTCSLTPNAPFKLVSTFKNYYSLVLDSALDRESVAAYELEVTARDGGSPPLSATARVSVEVADVNDNAPTFAQAEYTVFVKENNPPGSHIFTVSARDADAQENARVSYSLVERRVGERALSSYVSVHAESGKVYALQPLDHEELEVLRFQVSARDAGVPALGGNVTLQVFVLDENDNAPALLPAAGAAAGSRGGGGGGGGGAGVSASELVPRSVGAGHVVAKVRAVDADSGYNAWLSYELQPAAGGARSPFRVGLYTGEVSTTRALDEADAPRQRLLVLVRDHGEPPLAATATVLVSLVDSGQALKTSSRAAMAAAAAGASGAAGGAAALVDVNVYLIIAICAVSSLLVLTLLLYTALRCSAPAAEGACGPGKPALVCSSAVGSWSSSQQRRHRVCSGEGPPKADLMAFSPSLPPGGNMAERNEHTEVNSDLSGNPRQSNPDWRYSASLRAGMHSSVHLEEAAVLRAGPGGPDQQWPTVSSATPEPEAGEVSPPVGAGVNSNSWTFKYGPGNPKQSGPGELPDKFIIPGSPAIISIRQEPANSQIDKSDFITFGKKEETKKKKKKKKGNKTQEKKEKGNSTTDNSDQ
ncbi:protocadherin alpha-1 isoform X3 [Tenrec ecaudatus]|uniref:protocadherin alpha-1 isoform X3 n=1 Tax=Tenrec ecaudatus TaxID=94439 RepID=UPI003F593CC1